MGRNIYPKPADIVSLKLMHDITNVHPVMTLSFRSNQPIYDLADSIINLSDNPANGETGVDWQVMSYRSMKMPDGTGEMYSCLLYPPAASARLNGLRVNASSLSGAFSAGSAPFISLPGPIGPFSDLFRRGVEVGKNTNLVVGAGWTLAYALMQTKIQKFRDLSTGANPNDWTDVAGKLPVLYLAGSTLLASDVSTLLTSKTQVVASAAVFPRMVDAQKIWQSRLSDYMLTGNERTRNFQAMNASMWNKMYQFNTNMAPQFLGSYDLSHIVSSGPTDDFEADPGPVKGYLLYKAYYDSRKADLPWTLFFGSLS